MDIAFVPVAGHHILGWIVIGVLAGALAGRVVRGGGFGLVRDMTVGLIGAVIGGVLLHTFMHRNPTSPSFLDELFVAFAGAVLLLIVGNMSSRRRWWGRRRSFF